MILCCWKNLQILCSLVILCSIIQSRSVEKNLDEHEEKTDAEDDMSFIQGFLSGDLSLGGGKVNLFDTQNTRTLEHEDLTVNEEDEYEDNNILPSDILKTSRRSKIHSRHDDERITAGDSQYPGQDFNKEISNEDKVTNDELYSEASYRVANFDGSEKLTEVKSPLNSQLVSYGRENKMDTFVKDNIQAQDRRLFIPFNPVSLEYVEAKYESLVILLPSLIDEAREVIIEDVATKNMIGYSFVFAYVVGATFDSLGYTLLFEQTMWQAITNIVTDKEYFGFVWGWWWYAFGYAGPWMFPTTFSSTGGVTDLRCSSEDYFQLFLDHDLTLNIQSFTELSPAENIILTSRLSRDFNLRLACVVNKRGDHREAARVSQTFQSLLYLVSLHGQLDTRELPETGPHDLAILDAELENVWGEIILLTDQVHLEVRDKRAHTAAVYVFVGFLNVMGMVGFLIAYAAIVEDELSKGKDKDKDKDKELSVEEKYQDVLGWFLQTEGDFEFVKRLGGAVFMMAPIGWGYVYFMSYFLFLEAVDPGCGPVDRDDVFSKYVQLGSIKDLLETGVGSPAAHYFLEEWRREMFDRLHCLVNTEEGLKLADTIDMFYNIAQARIDFHDT